MSGSTIARSNLREDNFQAMFVGTCQKISTSGSSQQLTAFGANTSVIRIFCTKDCHVKVATNPTAATDGTSMFLPGGIVEYFAVQGGQKLAVIQDTTAGVLYCTEGQ